MSVRKAWKCLKGIARLVRARLIAMIYSNFSLKQNNNMPRALEKLEVLVKSQEIEVFL